MAWAIENDYAGYTGTPIHVEPPYVDRRPTEDELKALGIRRGFPALHQGKQLPLRFFPRRARMQNKRKTFPHILTWDLFAFSQELADIVEGLEPGVHQFVPLELIPKGEDAEPLPYQSVNIMTCLTEAIDFERSEAPMKQYDDRKVILALREIDSGKVCIAREKIAGKHLWVTDEISGNRMTFSNELYEIFRERRLGRGYKGLELREV